MNKKPKNRISLAAVLASVVLVFLSGSAAAHGQTMSVSIPSLHLTSKERVVGFEILVTSGRIAAVPKVPIGWDVSISNDPSWNTVIKGSLRVGAAALDSNFFRDFLVIEKKESLGGAPFDIQGEIVVSEDFATERRIKIGMKDLVMKKVITKSSSRSR